MSETGESEPEQGPGEGHDIEIWHCPICGQVLQPNLGRMNTDMAWLYAECRVCGELEIEVERVDDE